MANHALVFTGGVFGVGGLLYSTLLLLQFIERQNLPTVDPRSDAYSKCIGTFMSDMTTYVNCLDAHASEKCLMDKHRMTNIDDGRNCLALITAVPTISLNARLIQTAHDVCYTYLKSYGECLGLAVEMEEFEPCFRREVFARVGVVVDRCKNESGFAPGDNDFAGVGGGMGGDMGIGTEFGKGGKVVVERKRIYFTR